MNTFSLKNQQVSKEQVSQEKIAPHDLALLSEKFKNDRFVEIPSFLEKEFAEKCYNFYHYDIPDNWFRLSSWPNPNESSDPYYQLLNDPSIKDTIYRVERVFNQGDFCYLFHRTVDDHKSNCSCFECEIRSFFKSSEMFNFLCNLTGKQISQPSGHFSSWYKKGDFLSSHHDEGNGDIGVILDFTKGWNPFFGGNLYLLEENWFDVKKVIVPKFNNLKVFDIPKEKNGVPHFVSTVTANDLPLRKRIAFGGWYK